MCSVRYIRSCLLFALMWHDLKNTFCVILNLFAGDIHWNCEHLCNFCRLQERNEMEASEKQIVENLQWIHRKSIFIRCTDSLAYVLEFCSLFLAVLVFDRYFAAKPIYFVPREPFRSIMRRNEKTRAPRWRLDVATRSWDIPITRHD